MPLPVPPPPLVQAPRWAGVGLREELLEGWRRFPMPSWPSDWWQRNYDLLFEFDTFGGTPMTERHLRIPGFPYPPPP